MTELPICVDLIRDPARSYVPVKMRSRKVLTADVQRVKAIDNRDDEADLIERAKRDRSAFATLYHRHYGAVANYVYRRLGDTHATEDVVAEVFLTAMRTLPRFRYRGIPIRAWLFRIASRAAGRWAQRQRRVITARLSEELTGDGAASDSLADERAEAKRTRLAMLSLAPKHQAVLSLHYLEGMSVAEVADVVGCRIGTVKSRLSRARESLHHILSHGR